MVDENKLPAIDLTQIAMQMEPVAPPLYNPDGTLNWALNSLGTATWGNPLVYNLYQNYNNTTKTF